MNIRQRTEQIEKLETFETPWHVVRFLGKFQLFGSQISVSNSGKSDYVTLNEAREAVAWLVSQLGGTVKWDRSDKS